MTPTAEQVEAYRRDGVLHVPGFIDGARMAELTAGLEATLAQSGNQSAWGGNWKQAFTGWERFKLTTMGGLHGKAPAWKAWLEDPDVRAYMAAFTGRPMKVADAMLIVKPPEVGQAFPPHQDGAYYGDSNPDFLIMTVYLDDVTEDNGGIRFLPGSHTQGMLTHTRDHKAYLPNVSLDDMVEYPAKAGDVALSSLFTIHGSKPNRSARSRAIVRVGWRPGA